MNNIHHMQYVKTPSGSIMPTGKCLSEWLEQHPTLIPGDKIAMQDGQLFAYVVEKLTDFDQVNTEVFCKEILQHKELLVLMRREHGKVMFEQFIYAERRVITPEGLFSKQVLVTSFGDPAWVNVSDHAVIVRRDDYEEDKAKYH
ncbi:hypothetical protein BM525_19720 (plasmid) [Alteromonas mediterranea]|uniref:Uncharacterized protein n=1 Tax=Alteromonas mediterranea TaxID=314275 RepID=A0AAC9JHX7_9ALTE|nr:hypothetical protein [Alteromonas mediterranea]APD92113.1 hypothetical protein BM524_19525 [Alteromonas mediterranea]APD99967.1 hypothetical protein BM525_19720 [Alteromonas mediterranea]